MNLDTTTLPDGADPWTIWAWDSPAGTPFTHSASVPLNVTVSNGSSSSSGGSGGSSSGSGSSSGGSSSGSSSGRNYLNGIMMGSQGYDSSTASQMQYTWEVSYDYSYGVSSGDGQWPGPLNGYPWVAAVYSQGTNHQTVVDNLKPYVSSLYAVRIDWEFNLWYSGDTATFDANFSDLASLIHAQLPGVKVIWNPNMGNADPYPYYPGDAAVDIVGLDAYCQPQYSSSGQACWDDYLTGQGGNNLTQLTTFGKQHGKPLAFPEWGDSFNDGVYINQLCRWANQNNVVYMGYWDSADSLGSTARLSSQPTDQQAYLQNCANLRYTGAFWPRVLSIPSGATP